MEHVEKYGKCLCSRSLCLTRNCGMRPFLSFYELPHYNPSNTLLTSFFQHKFKSVFISEKSKKKIVYAIYRYMHERSARFKNTKVIWLAGASRGGALALSLAHYFKWRCVNGDDIDPNCSSVKVIVSGNDAVTTRDDPWLGSYERVYLCEEESGGIYSNCHDANGHDFYSIFPGSSYTDNLDIRLVGGKSTGMDTTVHNHHHAYPRYGLYSDYEYSPGLCSFGHCFFNARYLPDVSHIMGDNNIIGNWLPENGPEMMNFFFEKAFGYTPDGCKRIGIGSN